ncbi:MAG: phosphatidate cytidylyltransferase [Bacillota bacterium]
MLRTRVLTVVLGAPPLLACLWYGGRVWAVAVALLAGAAAAEAVAMAEASRRLPAGVAAVLAGCLVLLLGGLVPLPLLLGATAVLLAVMILDAALYPRGVRAPAMLLGVLYPGLGLGHLVLLRQGAQGLGWSLFLLAAVWAADIAAYFVGLARGRHRLVPRLSPGKSREGALAGLLAAAVAGAVAAGPLLHRGAAVGVALGVGAAVAGMVGDLAESALKRAAGRKDSGRLVPGHGGVLDRFDSLAFAAPVLYWWKMLGGM